MFNLTEEIMWKGEKAKLVECYIGKTGVYGIYVSTFSRHIWDDEFVFRAVAPALLKDVSVSITLNCAAPSYSVIVESLQRQVLNKLKTEIEEIPHA